MRCIDYTSSTLTGKLNELLLVEKLVTASSNVSMMEIKTRCLARPRQLAFRGFTTVRICSIVASIDWGFPDFECCNK